MVDADELGGEEDVEGKSGLQTMNLKIKGMEGAKQISMNTNALEVKINAVQILKNLAKNLKTTMFEYTEDIAKLCIESLINNMYAQTIRRESAKCMRFLIGACKEHPEKQRALFIMTYVKLMEEMDKRAKRSEFEECNQILKEVSKCLLQFGQYKEKGLTIFSEADAKNFITKLGEYVKLIQEDKASRMKKIKVLAKQVDEEDMEYFMEDLEKIAKGIHHVMEINGALM